MKRLLLFLFCLPLLVVAQDQPLLIQGTSPGLYLNHKVAPKENYYSIGRLYNISPKEIAPFNKLNMEAGLSLGQVIMIPLIDNNFSQSGSAAPGEVLIPVYYVVHAKEGFYRISVNNNKVPIVSIKKWNNITKNEVSSGTPLIVGYLKVKKDLSLFANAAVLTPDQVKAAIQQQETTTSTLETGKADDETDTEEPVAKPATTVTNTPAPIKSGAKETPETTDVEDAEPVTSPVATFKQDETHARFMGFYGGTFKTDYDKHPGKNGTEDEKGDAAIFKSNSGWQDGKYYCLYDGAQAGSIVKIVDNTTGKIVYAKVLDAMPDMKENAGIILRISNAAAQELGVTDVKFDCTITYYK